MVARPGAARRARRPAPRPAARRRGRRRAHRAARSRDRWPGPGPAPPAAAGRPRAGAGSGGARPDRPTSSNSSSTRPLAPRARGPDRRPRCAPRSGAGRARPPGARTRSGASRTAPTVRPASSTTWSPSRTWPSSGRSNPAMMRSSVVLPLPDGPRMAVNEPSGTTRSMPRSTGCPRRPCARRRCRAVHTVTIVLGAGPVNVRRPAVSPTGPAGGRTSGRGHSSGPRR